MAKGSVLSLSGRLAVAVVFSVLVAATSRVGWNSGDAARSQFRLSWSGTAPTTEACRPPTEAEVEGMPVHMRPTQICEGGAIHFNLRVIVDGDTLVDGPLSSAGRGERAFSVYHEFVVRPGTHDLAVDFWPDSAVANLPGGLAHSLRDEHAFDPGRATLLTWRNTSGFQLRTENPSGGAS